ncbi:MAG: YeeE/YedE family protein [bacterium]
MEITTEILIWAFGIALLMGAIANKTNFCTMGAVSDAVNMGDTGRLRAWMFALAIAILGVMGMTYLGIADVSLTASNDTANPPYRTATFAWPRYMLGGLMFGVGMTLGSGCGNKTLLRLGGGNIKSLFVLLAMGAAAYAMIFTNFSYTAFLQWMQPAFVDLSLHDISDQSIPTVLASMFSIESPSFPYVVAAVVGGSLLLWALASKDFIGSFDNILGGLAVGLAVVAGWWVTIGPKGQALLEEMEMMDEPPFAAGAQSFTFVQPSGHLLRWAETGFASSLISFALVAAAGVVVGSLLYSLLARKFNIEWFSSWKDFATHMIGGVLMGLGGVLAMGCTIGQGVTGASTLAMGSFLALISIIIGSALTMKVQLYKMVYEEEASLGKALLTGMADLKLLPNRLRKFDAI